MNIFIVILSVVLFIGLVVAILFEQYVVSLVLLGLTLLLGIKVAVNARNEPNITLVPVNKIKILGYPLQEMSSTEVQWGGETKGETKGKYGKLRGGKKEEFKTEFDI
tara:strand:+ start:189 stop:509 length:321 start_codon:yes stop_codon:yes gene_type:complete